MRLGKMNFALAAGMMAVATSLASAAFGAGADPNGRFGSGGAVIPPNKHRGKGQANRRGKGAVSRPKKRPNMNHVLKRTKRKHRRAA